MMQKHVLEHRYVRRLFLVLGLSLLTSGAIAQDTDSAEEAAAEPEVIETITVTARRAAENVQDVPIPITVLSEEEIEGKQVINARDVQDVVPNIVFEPNTGTSSGAKIFLRGVGTDESLFTSDPAVGIYIDDVYIPRQTGASFDLFDLERVEVLRGPQGTIYGRNTNGGAIKLYTKKPSSDRAGNLRLSGGSDSEINGDIYLTGGNDATAVSLSAFYRAHDGYLRDLVNGRDVNDKDVVGARAKLVWDGPDDRLLTVAADTVIERSGSGFASSIIFNDDNDLYTLESGLDDSNDLDQTGVSLSYNAFYDGWRLNSITSFRQMDNDLLLDADGTPIPRFHLFQDQSQDQLSQEIQFVSTDGEDLQWQVGLFYFEESNDQPTQNIIFAPGVINRIQQDTTSYAGYGQVNYRTGGWLLTGGLRYSSEEKDFRVDSVLPDGVTPNFTFVDSDDWDTVDYRAEAAYRMSDEVMGYFTVSTGFKSGGFNGRGGNPAALASYDEEEVTNYEIGIKTDLADRRVRLNLNYYFNQYDGLQFTVLDDFGVFRTINAADTEIQGVEIDLRAILAPRLELTANLGTIDDEFKGSVDTFDPTGIELKQAPDLSYGLGLQYTWLLDGGYVTGNVNHSFTDSHFQNVANSTLIETQEYSITNVRVAGGPDSGKWDLFAYGRNVGDEVYFQGGFDIAALGIGVAYVNRPAHYGAGFTYRW